MGRRQQSVKSNPLKHQKIMNIGEKIVSVVTQFRNRTLDPVKHCLVYRSVGCSHVDGMLCNMRTCSIKAQIEVTPMTAKDVTPEAA